MNKTLMQFTRNIRYRALSATILVTLTAGCTQSQIDRLGYVGKEPPMIASVSPTEQPGYQPISWPAPEVKSAPIRTANSLWIDGNKTFFKDQRARNVGDILRVKISVQDKAELDNKTERKRDNTENTKAPTVFGMENKIFDFIVPGHPNPADLLDITSNTDTSGEGAIEREEVIESEVAAVVTQLLPNGNLVIHGTQEIRVNHEVRQLSVSGIVRPEDINSDNVIEDSKIAEARISYGGRGLVSDVQQPRLGTQVIDILSPF